jgi:zinc ribbon protein
MTLVCSWCSTENAEGSITCSNCGANLVPDSEAEVPGVTAVDAASIIRSRSSGQPDNPVLAWLNSEHSKAIAPPDDEVRREILRLELAAEVANLQAEADALAADAALEAESDALAAAAVAESAEAEAEAEGESVPAEVAAAAPEAAEAQDSADDEDKATA